MKQMLVRNIVKDLVVSVIDPSLFTQGVPIVSTDGSLLATSDGALIIAANVKKTSSRKPKTLYVSSDGSLLATPDGSIISL